MRLVIDMQGAQTASRFRGIGRYTWNFVQALVRGRGEHEIILALNGLFPETVESIRAAFDGLLPQENIRVWQVVGPVRALEPDNEARRSVAEKIREAFLASLQPDMVLVTSLFEGFVDDAVTSIGAFTSLPTAAILYDLIPLIHPDAYLADPTLKRWYLNKIDHLRRTDLLLAISSSSGREAVNHLDFPGDRIANVGAACDGRFRPREVDEQEWAYLRRTYGISHPFVLYTGVVEYRKNVDRLIRSYARLPRYLRASHQLVLICQAQPHDRERLYQLARKTGMEESELVLTGFVSDEDLVLLYSACRLFVFPSWHEGFGLPVLEAMRCGKAVIAAATSSLPEVVGRDDALFDPYDEEAMTAKMAEVLGNTEFRRMLERHGLEQAKRFSWEKSACRAWKALESCHPGTQQSMPLLLKSERPRLAFVSPLPPAANSISDYSADLLPELARHYRLEVIVEQEEAVNDPWILANCPVRDVIFFRAQARRYDRVLYHFGNSEFHEHMFELLREIPGVVVLHDFYLSGILAHMERTGAVPHAFTRALLHSHGWVALSRRFQEETGLETAIGDYPANLAVLQQALGVIVHSEHARRLARDWYGAAATQNWTVIPLLRQPVPEIDRPSARRRLGLADDDFVVASFGIIHSLKLSHRLLSAWLDSPLAKDPRCRLVFVGQNHPGEYGARLQHAIAQHAARDRIVITGRVDEKVWRDWLQAVDVGVQLRARSRGETSAAVLDCMNHGLATVVNAHGALAELSSEVVWKLPDTFSDAELVQALVTLRDEPGRRAELGRRAQAHVRVHHAPRRCADCYAEAIEACYRQASRGLPGLFEALSDEGEGLAPDERVRLAAILGVNFPPRPRRRQLLVDVSELAQRDVKTGIQRVVRALLAELLRNPPPGWAVEPVYAISDRPGYRYARRFTSGFLGLPGDWAEDEPVEAWPGDVFFGLDLQHHVTLAQRSILTRWSQIGIQVLFTVYDLLPLELPHVFPGEVSKLHHQWLETITAFDGALCISRAVADELHLWLRSHGAERGRPFALHWFHLGADVDNSVPTRGMPPDAKNVLEILEARPSFLMVGTLEPRKAHAQVLSAFERLWRDGIDVNLIIVGKQGWQVESLVERLRTHAELGRRLFWLEGISDEYLEAVYGACTCLIMASYGEGFGLPLIEAAQHRLPLIVRDLPVFREVAGKHAWYFADDTDPDTLAAAVRSWLAAYRAGEHPRSEAMPWQTWKDSARQVIGALLGERAPYRIWPDGGVIQAPAREKTRREQEQRETEGENS